ncbi:MAG: von Willebrand factor type A domain-containing protein, partial [Bacteroidota bacterium]
MKKYIAPLFLAFLFIFTNCTEEDGFGPSVYADEELGPFADPNTGDQYNVIEENPFITVEEQAVSTFSIDADGASYSNMRRFIEQDNQKPPKAAIRTEELINYFDLDYPYNSTEHPIDLNGEVS